MRQREMGASRHAWRHRAGAAAAVAITPEGAVSIFAGIVLVAVIAFGLLVTFSFIRGGRARRRHPGVETRDASPDSSGGGSADR